MYDDVRITTSYLDGVTLTTVTGAQLEEQTGSSDGADDTHNLRLDDSGSLTSWVLFGGRDAARTLAARLVVFVGDDSNWPA